MSSSFAFISSLAVSSTINLTSTGQCQRAGVGEKSDASDSIGGGRTTRGASRQRPDADIQSVTSRSEGRRADVFRTASKRAWELGARQTPRPDSICAPEDRIGPH